MPVTLRGVVVRCILLTNSELKSVEGVLVDLLQLLLHLDGEVDQVAAVSVLVALKRKLCLYTGNRYQRLALQAYLPYK